MSLPPKRDRPRTTGTRGDWDITKKAPAKKKPPAKKARSALKSTKGLERGKPMERGKPLDRGTTELARTKAPERTTRLAPVSAATKARRPDREAVRKLVCALAHLGPCEGVIDTHEVVRRSQLKGAAYMDELTIGLCRKHHRLDEFKLTAERIGIRIRPDFYRQDPERYLAEAARLRVLAVDPMAPASEPSWWSFDDRLEWETNAERRKFAIRG